MILCVGATSIAQSLQALVSLAYLLHADWDRIGAVIQARANTDQCLDPSTPLWDSISVVSPGGSKSPIASRGAQRRSQRRHSESNLPGIDDDRYLDASTDI